MIPDSEDDARTWARSAIPLVAGRVFFGFPPDSPALPLITVSRISGISDDTVPVDYPRLTWSVWGANKKQAADVWRQLVDALRDNGAFDIFSVWLPDSEAKLARYVVDATQVAKADAV